MNQQNVSYINFKFQMLEKNEHTICINSIVYLAFLHIRIKSIHSIGRPSLIRDTDCDADKDTNITEYRGRCYDFSHSASDDQQYFKITSTCITQYQYYTLY